MASPALLWRRGGIKGGGMTLDELKLPANESDPVLIFIHGILSNAESCWTHASGTSWPHIVKGDPSLQDCGIYTFTYRSAVSGTRFSITDAADTLWEILKDGGLVQAGRLPLFVCHSMGGIVLRRMLVKQQAELSRLGVNLVGLFLVASPSMGSRWATWFLPLTGFMGHIQAMALSSREKNIWLQDLKVDFLNLCESGAIKIFGKELLEEQPIALKWLPWMPPVVRRIEGATYFANPVTVGGTDHFTVAKPSDMGAIQHIALRNFVKELRQRASTYCATIPAGATFAEALFGVGKSLKLDVDWNALTQSELDATSAVERQVSGTNKENMLAAVATAFPFGAVRSYAVTIRGTTALLSVS